MTENAPAEPAPHGWLQLTVQQPLRGWRVSPPQVVLDGRVVPAGFGPNTIRLPPGTHHVKVTPPFRLINVESEFEVREGQVSSCGTRSRWRGPTPDRSASTPNQITQPATCC